MPVELVSRKKCASNDIFESYSPGRLSSFGFSGTIAHGAFVPAVYHSMSGCLSHAHIKLASQFRAQKPSLVNRATPRTEPRMGFHVEQVRPG